MGGYDDISAEIPDPEAEQPEDWDTEEDGEWEAPMIDNPEYKGEWKAPMIGNPDYEGEWVHPVIANAEYKPETYAKYASLTTVGFELDGEQGLDLRQHPRDGRRRVR